MWRSLQILTVFNTSTLQQIFPITIFFSKNWSTIIYLKVLRLKKPHFHAKLPCQKPMLKQIEWGVQNGAITKTRILPVTDLTFHKRWSFVQGHFFSVSILEPSGAQSNFFTRLQKVICVVIIWEPRQCQLELVCLE